MSMFVRDAWYVACTPEVTGKPLGRQICGEKMVFFRGQDSLIVALDFCPHRGAPPPLGYVEDGDLVRGYHGLTMGADGNTVSMPGQRVQCFPCINPIRQLSAMVFLGMAGCTGSGIY
jgi:vanillate O-demethylase monooxygenase subunit